MNQSSISSLILNQKKFFNSGTTKDISFRIKQLINLKKAIMGNEEEILDACKFDMKKPLLETYVSERSIALNEIDYAVKHLNSWAKPQKVKTPIKNTRMFGIAHHLFASSYIYAEPFGVVLIIGPWNYPFQLTLSPLVGAIAAGNCAIIKPSEIAPHSSGVIAKIIRDHFDSAFISVVEGGVETAQTLLAQDCDYIFFTGSPKIGRMVMKAAAEHLTPVTLELGGKNPCIVDHDIHPDYTARRIVWGKFFNAGQTCMTTDYLLVDKAVKDELIGYIKKYIRKYYGDDPSQSKDFSRIVNKSHFDRLSELLQEGNIIMGGEINADDLYIAPTVIDNISLEHKIMEDEVFGPILPVIEYENLEEAIEIVRGKPKPLALFFFSRDKKKQDKVLRETSSGGGCINETFVHQICITLPFGGVGNSGMGKYHGRFSFDTFSNKKGILKKSFFFDSQMRCPPYSEKFKKLRKYL